MARRAGYTGGLAPSVGIEIEGADAIIEALDQLGAITARRIVRPAVNKALTPINKAAKANLTPGHGKDTGALRHAIGKRVVYYRRSGTIWGGVGPRTDKRFDRPVGKGQEVRRPWLYAHLIELGVAPHSLTEAFGQSKNRSFKRTLAARRAQQRGKGLHPGYAKIPFLRPALDQNAQRAFTILGQAVFAGIERHLAKTRSAAA